MIIFFGDQIKIRVELEILKEQTEARLGFARDAFRVCGGAFRVCDGALRVCEGAFRVCGGALRVCGGATTFHRTGEERRSGAASVRSRFPPVRRLDRVLCEPLHQVQRTTTTEGLRGGTRPGPCAVVSHDHALGNLISP
ncbi:hypothetical protein ACSQ67_019543 [Phaseolus vulgaris]